MNEAVVELVLAAEGLVIPINGVTHGVWLMVSVFVSVPHVPVAVITILFEPGTSVSPAL